jgi:CheY-like chemotaxis protein
MNGYEATKLIKKTNSILLIIAQTAYALSQDRAEILYVGCDNYIPNPISKVELIKLLIAYLN